MKQQEITMVRMSNAEFDAFVSTGFHCVTPDCGVCPEVGEETRPASCDPGEETRPFSFQAEEITDLKKSLKWALQRVRIAAGDNPEEFAKKWMVGRELVK